MLKVMESVEMGNYNINEISLIDITHYKISNEIVSLGELLRIKEIVDYCIDNIEEENRNEEE